MSADARVARAIQRVRAATGAVGGLRHPTLQEWWTCEAVINDLIDEAKDALHLTDEDIANY